MAEPLYPDLAALSLAELRALDLALRIAVAAREVGGGAKAASFSIETAWPSSSLCR